jgi:enoyl-CoA hydratase/carnithine racemase
VPEAASSLTAVQRMGQARAFELLCLGEPFNADRGREAGIINAIVPAADLEATAMKAARRLAAKPRGALMAARRLMRGDPAALSAQIDAEAKVFGERYAQRRGAGSVRGVLRKAAAGFQEGPRQELIASA